MTNHFTLVGTVTGVTRDRVTKLVLSVPDRRKDRESGEWVTVQMPVSVTVFGDRLNALVDNLPDDALVAVTGRVSGREYQGKVYVDLVASDVVAGAGEPVQDRNQMDDIPF